MRYVQMKEEVTLPSSVYLPSDRNKQRMREILPNWTVVAFRPPNQGEQFIASYGEVATQGEGGMRAHNGEPRFIVVPRKPAQTLEDIWE